LQINFIPYFSDEVPRWVILLFITKLIPFQDVLWSDLFPMKTLLVM
jgi:hypothetical protein